LRTDLLQSLGIGFAAVHKRRAGSSADGRTFACPTPVIVARLIGIVIFRQFDRGHDPRKIGAECIAPSPNIAGAPLDAPAQHWIFLGGTHIFCAVAEGGAEPAAVASVFEDDGGIVELKLRWIDEQAKALRALSAAMGCGPRMSLHRSSMAF
jgi:hypothetical protein